MAIGTSKSKKPRKTRIIHADPEIMGGVPVFVGTRVPVKTLFEYLEYGHPLDDFLDHFPSVSRPKALAVLRLARDLVDSHADCA